MSTINQNGHCIECIVCIRCDFPICTAEDVCFEEVDGGVTDAAFRYDFEDFHCCPRPVPCYSRQEVNTTSYHVSPEVLKLPLTSYSKRHALFSLAQSEGARGRPLEGVESTLNEIVEEEAAELNCCTIGGCFGEGGAPDTSVALAELKEQVSLMNSCGATKGYAARNCSAESRVDVIAVSSEVLGAGVELCTTYNSTDKNSGGSQMNIPQMSLREEGSETSTPQLKSPKELVKWDSPGNFTVDETVISVQHSTLSSQKPLFQRYSMSGKVECPDCHLSVGYYFVRTPNPNSENVTNGSSDAEGREDKRLNNECEDNEAEGDEKYLSRLPHIGSFVALELQRLKERVFTLRYFQDRYRQAKNNDTLREIIPGAEELQILNSKLMASRMEAVLHRDLLSKHKEHFDLRTSTLHMLKERLEGYERSTDLLKSKFIAQLKEIETLAIQCDEQKKCINTQKVELAIQSERVRLAYEIIEAKDENLAILVTKLNTLQEMLELKKEERAEEATSASPSLLSSRSTPNEERFVSLSEKDAKQDDEKSHVEASPHIEPQKFDIHKVLAKYGIRLPDVPPVHLRGVVGNPSFEKSS